MKPILHPLLEHFSLIFDLSGFQSQEAKEEKCVH